MAKGNVYGGKNSRPVGNAGRGRHTGSAGWLGGKHRDNSGCLGVFVLLIIAASVAVPGLVYVTT